MGAIFKLFKYVGKYKKDTFLTWLGVICESLCEVLVVFMMQYLIDSVKLLEKASAQTASGEIAKYAAIIAVLAVAAAGFGILAGWFCSSASAGFGKNLRSKMYDCIQKYSFKNIDKFSTASIITRTTTDVTNVQNSFQQLIRAVIRAPIMMVLGILMCFITEPKVAWIFLIAAPLVLLGLIGIATLVHPTMKKIFETYDDLNKVVQENVEGMRVVKSFNREEQEQEKFSKTSLFIAKGFIKAEKVLALNGPLMNTAIYGCIIGISYVSGLMIVSSNEADMSVGQLTSLISFVMLIMMSLMMISMVYVIIMIGKNSAERIGEIIDEVPDIVSPINGLKEVKDGSIDFKDVTFAYHEGRNVIERTNISIKSGEMIGILGSTGAGKTTLTSLVARLYDATTGSVFVGGHDVKEYDLKSLRDAVSVVLQKNTLFSGTLRSNLLWGDENATEKEIQEAMDCAQVTPILKELDNGLDTKIDQGGTNVSGGQKQRICIARALLKKPKVLILDDSTSACDTRTDALIREGLKNIKKDVTKLIIAQRVQSIKDCDQILVMDKGEIIGHGKHDDLLTQCQVYRELYESQMKGGDFDAKN